MINSNGLDYSQLPKKLIPMIESLMKKHKITGSSIAIVDSDNIVWSQGFGYSNKEEGIRASAETIYSIGSITKVFTGIAIMQLVERGMVNLDKPITEYIPEFSVKNRFADSNPITLRSLMTHHSGLPCDNRRGFYSDSPFKAPERFTSTLEYLKNNYMSYPCNFVYSYSNLGTALLGIVIEKTSGIQYEEYIKANILDPLGMNNTAFEYAVGKNTLLSKGYNNVKGEYEPQMRDIPVGGLHSSVLDMAKFLGFILSQKDMPILQRATLNKMFEVQNADNPFDFGFKTGLNWIMSWPSLESEGKVIWHDGGSIYYLSLLAAMPEHSIGVVVFTNSERGVHLNHPVTDESLKLMLKIKKGISISDTDTTDSMTLTIPKMDKICGSFATPSGLIKIFRKGPKLFANMKGMNLMLLPRAGGWFSLELRLFGRFPVKLKQLRAIRLSIRDTSIGKILGMEQSIGQNWFRQPVGIEFKLSDIPHTWINAVGKYKALDANNMISGIQMIYSNQILYIKATVRKLGGVKFVLRPVSDREAIIQGLGRFAGETVFLKDGIVRLSGLEFMKIRV